MQAGGIARSPASPSTDLKPSCIIVIVGLLLEIVGPFSSNELILALLQGDVAKARKGQVHSRNQDAVVRGLIKSTFAGCCRQGAVDIKGRTPFGMGELKGRVVHNICPNKERIVSRVNDKAGMAWGMTRKWQCPQSAKQLGLS